MKTAHTPSSWNKKSLRPSQAQRFLRNHSLYKGSKSLLLPWTLHSSRQQLTKTAPSTNKGNNLRITPSYIQRWKPVSCGTPPVVSLGVSSQTTRGLKLTQNVFTYKAGVCNVCTWNLISENKALQHHMLHFLNKGIRDQTKRKQQTN